MHLLFHLRRQYTSPLPPTALLRRLEHTVLPRPAGFFWWLGIRYLPCWGKVSPATSSFRARMRWGRSNGAVIRGFWQEVPAALLLDGTLIQLTIRLPLSEMIGGSLMLAFLLISSLLLAISTGLSVLTIFVAGITGVFGLLFLTDAWWSICKAERHFQAALALSKLTTKRNVLL